MDEPNQISLQMRLNSKENHHGIRFEGGVGISDLDIVHMTHLTKTPSEGDPEGSHLEIHLRPSAYKDIAVRA